jgi:acyl carrier protein
MKTTLQRLQEIVVEQLGVNPEQVTPSASFVHDLGADSLDTVELVMAVEEEFIIEIPDVDTDGKNDMTVQEAVDLIDSKNPAPRE